VGSQKVLKLWLQAFHDFQRHPSARREEALVNGLSSEKGHALLVSSVHGSAGPTQEAAALRQAAAIVGALKANEGCV
jgi:hypothetical protein